MSSILSMNSTAGSTSTRLRHNANMMLSAISSTVSDTATLHQKGVQARQLTATLHGLRNQLNKAPSPASTSAAVAPPSKTLVEQFGTKPIIETRAKYETVNTTETRIAGTRNLTSFDGWDDASIVQNAKFTVRVGPGPVATVEFKKNEEIEVTINDVKRKFSFEDDDGEWRGGLSSALNSISGISASFNAQGRLQIVSTEGSAITLANETSSPLVHLGLTEGTTNPVVLSSEQVQIGTEEVQVGEQRVSLNAAMVALQTSTVESMSWQQDNSRAAEIAVKVSQYARNAARLSSGLGNVEAATALALRSLNEADDSSQIDQAIDAAETLSAELTAKIQMSAEANVQAADILKAGQMQPTRNKLRLPFAL